MNARVNGQNGSEHTLGFWQSRTVKGVLVDVMRDGVGRRVTASGTVEIRGVFEYRVVAHSRKLSPLSVHSFIHDFAAAAAAGDDSRFYDLRSDAQMDYQFTSYERKGASTIVFNLDSEKENV